MTNIRERYRLLDLQPTLRRSLAGFPARIEYVRSHLGQSEEDAAALKELLKQNERVNRKVAAMVRAEGKGSTMLNLILAADHLNQLLCKEEAGLRSEEDPPTMPGRVTPEDEDFEARLSVAGEPASFKGEKR